MHSVEDKSNMTCNKLKDVISLTYTKLIYLQLSIILIDRLLFNFDLLYL